MKHILTRLATAAGLALLVIGSVRAQGGDPKKKADAPEPRPLKETMKRLLDKAEEEYRIFFKKPETTPEFWSAIKFEIQVGKFDVAALHLKQMLNQKPAEKVDAALVSIEEAEGMSSFLRLRSVRQWTDHPILQKEAENNVEALIDRVTAAAEKHLGDPVRLNKYINNLGDPTPEVRAYAFAQLQRARGRAAPYLVEALRRTVGTVKHQRIIEAMVKLDSDIIPPLLEVLNARDAKDAAETDLRLSLLEVIRRRGDKRAIPYLWSLSSSPRYPPLVRAAATETLATLLQTDPRQLPPAKVMLTDLTEKLYRHQVKFLDPQRILVWPWKDRQLSVKPVVLTARDYEELFGRRYAKQALELDPSYRPAQVAFLNFTLERSTEDRLGEFFTGKGVPPLDQLLASIDADLVMQVLDRALAEHNLAVILPTIKALGDRGEVRAARPGLNDTPGPLVRALYYPDRRVQFAAAIALLRMPTGPAPPAAGRVVEVLRRFLAAGPAPKALVAFAPDLKAADLRKQLKAAGFDAIIARDLKETMDALHRAANIDVILLHYGVRPNELPYVVSQLNADADGGLPLLFVAPIKREGEYVRQLRRYRNSGVISEAYLSDPDELKTHLQEAIKLAAAPDSVLKASEQQRTWLKEDLLKRKNVQLTEPERKLFAAVSLDALVRMARGEIKGYDVRAAEPTVVDALRGKDTVVPAIEILTTFPGAATQQRLAALVLDAQRGKERVTAAMALNRHVQRNGMALRTDQVAQLRQLAAAPGTDPVLRAELAILMGSLRTTAEQTGNKLYRFNP